MSFQLLSPVTAELDYTGSLVRAAFLGLVNQLCPELSAYLHDAKGPKPYSLTPLTPHRKRFGVSLRQGNTYGFSVTLLREEDLSTILDGMVKAPNMKVRLYSYDLPVSSIDMDYISLEQLSEKVNGMPDDFRLSFLSPTYLNEYGTGHHSVFPDPAKVFPNMLRTWNSFSSTGKCETVSEYYDWVNRNIIATGYWLTTMVVPLTKGRRTVGFVGDCNYHREDTSSAYAKLTHTLCRFAEYSNVGGSRTAGFGVVKFIPKDENKHGEEIKTSKDRESDP